MREDEDVDFGINVQFGAVRISGGKFRCRGRSIAREVQVPKLFGGGGFLRSADALSRFGTFWLMQG